MRTSTIVAVLMAFIVFNVSCGGDSGQETAESPREEVSSDFTVTEEPAVPDEADHQQDTVEITSVVAGPEGSWDTTMGKMELSVDDSGTVTGEYPLGTIEGTLTGNVLEFTYSEASLSGDGSFTFEDDFNSFTGVEDISGTELVWNGNRI